MLDDLTIEPHPRLAEKIAQILPEIIATRHTLHQNPELSGAEEQTAALVAQRLGLLSLDSVQTQVGGHGVVGILHGEADGPTLALRADMDALPIQETSDLPYRSCKPGVMHACGHDGHTATLLGAATVLADMRPLLPGTVKFIFQPAEEGAGGADGMCDAGVMDGVDAIVALHGWPFLDVGQIGLRAGPMMASSDTFDLTIKGKGGHAAYPQTTVDPIVIAAQIIQAFQTLTSREISPFESVVVSVTQVQAGTAYNVIAGTAELKGTVRTLSNTIRNEMPGKMERIVAGLCAAFRADYTFTYTRGTQVVVNDASMIGLLDAVGTHVLGAGHVQYLETPTMGAEDFASYLAYAPGAMFRLGVGRDVTALHTPTYNFTDEALQYGIAMFASVAMNYRKK